jgi:hypothetical protein
LRPQIEWNGIYGAIEKFAPCEGTYYFHLIFLPKMAKILSEVAAWKLKEIYTLIG